MPTPAPPSVVEGFATNGAKNTIPIPSQIATSPELASFNDGFPPATRLPRTTGGIPPRGLDMNGILFMISAHTAWMAAGGTYSFNADVVTVQGGYGIGAIIRSASNPQQFFYNTVNNNTNNPDSVITGWLPFSPISVPVGSATASTPAAGLYDNFPLDSGVGFLDFNPTAGNISVSGFSGGENGQDLIVTNIHPTNTVQLMAFGGGSSSGNQLRMPANITLLQYSSVRMRKSTGIGKWVVTL